MGSALQVLNGLGRGILIEGQNSEREFFDIGVDLLIDRQVIDGAARETGPDPSSARRP